MATPASRCNPFIAPPRPPSRPVKCAPWPTTTPPHRSRLRLRACACVYGCACACVMCLRLCMRLFLRMRVSLCVHLCTVYVHMYAYMYVYKYKYIFYMFKNIRVSAYHIGAKKKKNEKVIGYFSPVMFSTKVSKLLKYLIPMNLFLKQTSPKYQKKSNNFSIEYLFDSAVRYTYNHICLFFYYLLSFLLFLFILFSCDLLYFCEVTYVL